MKPIEQIDAEVRELRVRCMYENYIVDESGNIYSRPRKRAAGGIVRPHINAYGYPMVKVSINGKQTSKTVHRIHRKS